ncbi:LPXTG cell wall anchor domain-containing protein [Periweissella cryptocerci]|uniref:LPXTG cell wall anchor domain-containing protein n=1 Tax=Periweissella cryptocerci TaxID=2506420 RepID=A0A4P6YSE3_9LACO|nr:LPXTG cell wall anchor domain-containing protein [Periweissella cryptocerci]QBO35619.1 LPXTG cell wall anchor domain-containing protein [Periweissella cryptocerci]
MTVNEKDLKMQTTEDTEIKNAKNSKNTKIWLGAGVAAASMFMMSNSNIAGVSADSTSGSNDGNTQDDSDAQAAVTAQGVDEGQTANYENATSTQTGYKTEHNTVNVNYSNAVSKEDAVKHFDGVTKAAAKYGAGTRVGKQTIGKAAGVKLNASTVYDEDEPTSVEKTDDQNATVSLPVKATTGAKKDKINIKLHANIAADKDADDTTATEKIADTTAVATTQAATPAVQAEASTPAVQADTAATPVVQAAVATPVVTTASVTALKTAAPAVAATDSLADLQAKTEAKAIADYTNANPDQEDIQLDGATTMGNSTSLADVPADLQAAGLFNDQTTTSDPKTSYVDPTKDVAADTDVTVTGQQTFTNVDMVPGLPAGSYTSTTSTVPVDTTPVFKDQLTPGSNAVATGSTAVVSGGSGLTQAAADALKGTFNDAKVVASSSTTTAPISVLNSDSQQSVNTGDGTTKGTFNSNITVQITQDAVNSGAFDQAINPASSSYNPQLVAQIFNALNIQFNGIPAQGTYNAGSININGKVYTGYYDIPAVAGGRHAIVVIDWNNYNGSFYTHHASMFELAAGSDDQDFATGASNYGMDFRMSVQAPAQLFDVVRPTYTSTKQETKVTYTQYTYTTTTHDYTWFNAKATGKDKVPDTPITPEVPAEPDTPTNPEVPAKPDTPTNPEVPAEPDTPTNPEIPGEPVTPEAPLTPFPNEDITRTPGEDVPVPPTSNIPEDIKKVAPSTPKKAPLISEVATTPTATVGGGTTITTAMPTNLATNVETKTATTPLSSATGSNQNRLPQTGESKSDNWLAALGVTLLGFLGLGAAKRRKKGDK